MAWHITDDLGRFDAAAGAFLHADRTGNTLLISVPAALRARGPHAFGPRPARFGWFEGATGEVESVFVVTPPHPLLIGDLPPESAGQLADALLLDGRPIAGVSGPVEAAWCFAREWHERTRADAAVHLRLRLYALGRLTVPKPAPVGAARVATAADRETVLRWYRDFATEVGEPSFDAAAVVDDRIGYGGLALWEVDGSAVAMAGATRPIAGAIRIGPVYTPKESRGRGYGGAITAAVARAALDVGVRHVSLFTDLANPTSNALYQRVGFRPVDDRVILHFDR